MKSTLLQRHLYGFVRIRILLARQVILFFHNRWRWKRKQRHLVHYNKSSLLTFDRNNMLQNGIGDTTIAKTAVQSKWCLFECFLHPLVANFTPVCQPVRNSCWWELCCVDRLLILFLLTNFIDEWTSLCSSLVCGHKIRIILR